MQKLGEKLLHAEAQAEWVEGLSRAMTLSWGPSSSFFFLLLAPLWLQFLKLHIHSHLN